LSSDRDLDGSRSGPMDLGRKHRLTLEAPTEPAQFWFGKILRRSLPPRAFHVQASRQTEFGRTVDAQSLPARQLLLGALPIVHGECVPAWLDVRFNHQERTIYSGAVRETQSLFVTHLYRRGPVSWAGRPSRSRE